MPAHVFAETRGALARPRFLLGKTFSDGRDSLKLELDAGEAVFTDLAARRHEISPIPAQSPLAGHPGAIRIKDNGRYTGAHAPAATASRSSSTPPGCRDDGCRRQGWFRRLRPFLLVQELVSAWYGSPTFTVS